MPVVVDVRPVELPTAPAKLRILETADRLFYDEGIRTVGVDRLINDANVTKATFYKHYRSKDRVILAYIEFRRDAFAHRLARHAAAADTPEDALRALLHDTTRDVQSDGFRGCPFINAAAEFADPDHPVRRAVRDHRDWFGAVLADLLRHAGHPMPGEGADELQVARDGALSGGYAGDPVAASAAVTRVFERVLDRTGL